MKEKQIIKWIVFCSCNENYLLPSYKNIRSLFASSSLLAFNFYVSGGGKNTFLSSSKAGGAKRPIIQVVTRQAFDMP